MRAMKIGTLTIVEGESSNASRSKFTPLTMKKTGMRKPKPIASSLGLERAIAAVPRLRQRVVELLNQWSKSEGGVPVRVLEGTDLDLGVARGAAYYGLVRRGKGVRIRGGSPRTYYVGVETSLPAVPGSPPPIKALCVVPFGMEEGTEADIPAQEFGLVIGAPAQFRFHRLKNFPPDPYGRLPGLPFRGSVHFQKQTFRGLDDVLQRDLFRIARQHVAAVFPPAARDQPGRAHLIQDLNQIIR